MESVSLGSGLVGGSMRPFPAWHLQGDNFVALQSHLRQRALKDSNQNSKEKQGFRGKMPGVYAFLAILTGKRKHQGGGAKVSKRFQAEDEPWADLRV